ncbi:MAG: enoyl-CoA hydratase/isomerase family protein [Deltaproteobacteria bacterium]|nr:enoyl-CoA hydratase/isomerase family protein [Deltaproteobacteria bacterium]
MYHYQQIIYAKKGPVARVKMNRPHYRNAQSRILLEELNRAFNEAVSDDAVRVIVLSGEGDHFSSGHDLGTPEQKADQAQRPYADGTLGKYQRQWELFHDMGMRWRDLPKPTIAEIHGYCIFGGWLIASAMDIIVASEDALFLPSFLQYFSVPWDIGVRKTKEILFQMRFIKAKEAMDLGFVNIVTSRDKLRQETQTLAERIAESDPLFTRLVKLSINQVQDAGGFRVAAQSAFSNYMLISQAGLVRSQQEIDEGKRSLSRVDQAFKHLKESA